MGPRSAGRPGPNIQTPIRFSSLRFPFALFVFLSHRCNCSTRSDEQSRLNEKERAPRRRLSNGPWLLATMARRVSSHAPTKYWNARYHRLTDKPIRRNGCGGGSNFEAAFRSLPVHLLFRPCRRPEAELSSADVYRDTCRQRRTHLSKR